VTDSSLPPVPEVLTSADGRIVLRRPRRSDADAIRDYGVDDAGWLSSPSPGDRVEDPHALVHEYEAGWRGEPNRLGMTLVIAQASTDRLVGVVHLQEHEGLWVDYGVAPDHRGRGIAAAALQTICGWAFQDAAHDRVQLEIGIDNHASQRAAERAGFSRARHGRATLPLTQQPHEYWIYRRSRPGPQPP
jgi:RimJ/RimL family protein N-acetyltransferase